MGESVDHKTTFQVNSLQGDSYDITCQVLFSLKNCKVSLRIWSATNLSARNTNRPNEFWP